VPNLETLKCTGHGKIWESVERAVDAINSVVTRDDSRLKRILLITDGEDSLKESVRRSACQKLRENDVRLDVIALPSCKDINKCKEDFIHSLIPVSHLTGGLVFLPQSFKAADALLNNEYFVNLSLRDIRVDLPKNVTEMQMKWIKYQDFDTTCQFKYKQTDLLTAEKPTAAGQHATFQETRLAKEFNICRNHKVHVYLCNNPDGPKPKPGIWRIFIPISGFQLGEVLWDILVVFPPHYPLVPPVFKFISIPNPEFARRRISWTPYHPKMHVLWFIRQIQKLKITGSPDWKLAQLEEAYKGCNFARAMPLPDIACLQIIDQRNPSPAKFLKIPKAKPDGHWTNDCFWSQVTGKRFSKGERSNKHQFVIPTKEDFLLA
jgi:hypothetical protein